MAISEQTELLIRLAWAAQIPQEFRALAPDKEWRAGAAHIKSSLSARIPSSFSKNDLLFDREFANRHVTLQQQSENKRREAISAKQATKKRSEHQRKVCAAAKHESSAASG